MLPSSAPTARSDDSEGEGPWEAESGDQARAVTGEGKGGRWPKEAAWEREERKEGRGGAPLRRAGRARDRRSASLISLSIVLCNSHPRRALLRLRACRFRPSVSLLLCRRGRRRRRRHRGRGPDSDALVPRAGRKQAEARRICGKSRCGEVGGAGRKKRGGQVWSRSNGFRAISRSIESAPRGLPRPSLAAATLPDVAGPHAAAHTTRACASA